MFKAIERQGGKVKQGERGVLCAAVLGEKVEFQVREKQKQERRQLTDDEKRWRSGDNSWQMVLVPTGRLVFEIKSWQWPTCLTRQWLETEKKPLEGMLSDILVTFVAAGPLARPAAEG